jgi:hypothetical protein
LFGRLSWLIKGRPVDKTKPEWWYRSRGYAKCILCNSWVKHSNVGFVHPICKSCQDENPNHSLLKDRVS